MKSILTFMIGFCVTVVLFGREPDIDFKSKSGTNTGALSEPARSDVVFANHSTAETALHENTNYYGTCVNHEEAPPLKSDDQSETSCLFSNNAIKSVTSFDYYIPKASFVSLTVYDLFGRRVRKLMNVYQAPGVYSGEWDALDDTSHHVPRGAYVLSIKADGDLASRQIMLVR